MRRRFDATFKQDPSKAVFGKRLEPFWNRLMPDFVRQEMAGRTPVESQASVTTPKSTSFAQSMSFSMYSSRKAKAKPIVEGTSTSWDSRTNQIQKAVYDPISGRMMPEEMSASASASSQTMDGPSRSTSETDRSYVKPASLSQLPQDDIDVLRASDIRAKMGKMNKADFKDLAARAQELAALEEHYKTKNFDNEHEELLEARKSLGALRTQVQILERRVHGSTLTKPDYALDAERPAFFEDGWNEAPQGMQTAFENEKVICSHGDKASLEQEMCVLNSEHVQEINDDYSVDPKGMQTQYEHEGEDGTQTLEQEMVALNKPQVHVTNDGYSTEPKGMQTVFLNESSASLEEEMKGLGKEMPFANPEDGYSTAPTGMQTSYNQEDVDTLEQELHDKLQEKKVDDGYSTEPKGMETSYYKEDVDSLEQELNKKLETKELDDGYSTKPKGMQTSFDAEDSDRLEQELNNGLKELEYDDGYSTDPKGMQTSYGKEGINSLEQELNKPNQSKGYEDGYSNSPSGLQTAFKQEQRESRLGSRQSLEKEMESQLENPPTDGGYATMPIGLQVLFRQEQAETVKMQRPTLEEELRSVRTQAAKEKSYAKTQTQKPQVQDHEDGYSRVPMGLQSSFSTEERSSKCLEEQLKAMQGEGDVCTNVGKFTNSGRWYKQPAPNKFSEEIYKAQRKAHDCGLVQDVQDVYERRYGGSITTENQQPQSSSTAGNQQAETTAMFNDAKDENLVAGEGTSSATPEPEPEPIKWAVPAEYKVVAYDVHKEAISITTTPSNFSNSETPLSISGALQRLHQPARFIPHFAELQKEGYQVIHASRDWLVFRKVNIVSSSKKLPMINPIDPKVSRHIPYEELPTGRFASPTGFVNHDPIFPPEPPKPAPGETVTVEIPVYGGADFNEGRYRVHERHNRRTRRDEPAYLGARKRGRGYDFDGDRYDRREKRTWSSKAAWALSVGAGTAACMYIVGIVGELAKGEQTKSVVVQKE